MLKIPYAGRTTKGVVWEDKGYTTISQIFISFGDAAISSLQFQYVDQAGNFVLSPRHGRDDGSCFSVVSLDPENEYLTGLSGSYDFYVITSLTFKANLHTYGPFGCDESSVSPFEFSIGHGRVNVFNGFHGSTCPIGLTSIGLFVRLGPVSLPQPEPLVKKET